MITLADLLQATNGKLYNRQAITFNDFAYDSRRTQANQIFIAVQTPKGDGHHYINESISAGCTGVLCQHVKSYPVTTIVVPDTKQALLDYARFILRKYQIPVVGVTGSNGKSTTKEVIATVLQNRFHVFKNFASYNGRYGLPIALGKLTVEHEVAVLEMASDHFGEIAEMTALVRPKVGIITNISHTHLAWLGSVENVALEKGCLLERLHPDGTAILNSDDEQVMALAEKLDLSKALITYGFSPQADLRLLDFSLYEDSTHFYMSYKGQTYRGLTKLLGKHQLYAVLAGIATGLVYEIPIHEALESIAQLEGLPSRLKALRGKNDSLILDDTFNASPASMRAAIDTLVEIGRENKIAVLGKMADLGHDEHRFHVELGQYVANKVDSLITFGKIGQTIADGARQAGFSAEHIHVTYTPADAIQTILTHQLTNSHATVLLKGSAESRLERVVKGILANPDHDQYKLARSEPGWEHVQIDLPDRPTWVEIDLEALRKNVRCLAKLAKPAKLMAVLKADGYGHGAIKTARIALKNGATWLAVATLGEGIILRESGVTAPILILGYLPAWQASEAIRYDIRVTVFNRHILHALDESAQRLQEKARVHVKVDTGMGRLGLLPHEVVSFIAQSQFSHVEIEGLFTHFGRADDTNLHATKEQLGIFRRIIDELKTSHLCPPIIHAANTAALLNFPESRFDMVRSGIGLYGLAPSPETPIPPEMKPVLSFKTTIAQVKIFPADSPIGYGADYHTQTEEKIAIIPVGYADGFRRSPHTWVEVLVKGKRSPIVGRVSMDQSAINISHIPNVQQGDIVVLIGKQGNEVITVEEVAKRLGTINYEVVSQILARVPRVS